MEDLYPTCIPHMLSLGAVNCTFNYTESKIPFLKLYSSFIDHWDTQIKHFCVCHLEEI